MKKKPVKPAVLKVPKNVPILIDKETGVQSFALQFGLSDGSNAIITVTKLSRMPWLPGDEIESLTVTYHDQ